MQLPHRLGWMAAASGALILAGCGSKPNPVVEEGDRVELTYPETRRVKQVDQYHGVEVQDPYRWLEADVRESPALDVLRLLVADGAEVEYHDPYVPSVNEEGHCFESVPLTAERLASADAAVILTDHSSFDFGWIYRHARILVDTRNATAKVPEARSSTNPERWIVKGGLPAEA